jgi:AcrR family transcriptional regulator
MKPSGRRHTREKADEILEVAFELFSSKNYSDVSMKDIARNTSSSYSLIYYYYNSKDEIFYSSVRYAIKKAIQTYTEINIVEIDPVQAINKWLDVNIKLSDSLKRLCKIMLEHSDRRGGSPTVEKDIKYFYKFEKTLLADSLRRGVQARLFACDDPDNFAAFISSGIDGIYYGALTRPGFSIRKSIELLRSNIWILLRYDGAERVREESVIAG